MLKVGGDKLKLEVARILSEIFLQSDAGIKRQEGEEKGETADDKGWETRDETSVHIGREDWNEEGGGDNKQNNSQEAEE